MERQQITKVIASGLIWHSRSLLLIKRARDFKGIKAGRALWEPPGGMVEIAEAIEEALRREVFEETGIRITTPPALTAVCHYTVEDEEIVAHRFHILYSVDLAFKAKVILSEEHADYCWVDDVAGVAGLDMIAELSDVVRAALRRW